MLATVALIVPVFLLIFIKKWKNPGNVSAKQLPPGPRTLPVVGNLHLLGSPPFRCFRDLSNRYGPIMYLKLGAAPVVVVSSPEIAEQMLKDQDPCFANRPRGVGVEIMWYNYEDMVFCPYGDYWRQMRKICIDQLLSPRMVRAFGSIRRDEAGRLVEYLRRSSGEKVNLTEKIFSFTSSIMCRASFGKVCRDNDALIKLVKKSVELGGGFEIADLFPASRIVYALSWTRMRLKMMRRKLDVILDDIIDEHSRRGPAIMDEREPGSRRPGNSEFGSEDLVDVLLRIKEEEQLQFPIKNDNIKAVLYDMLSAGTDTSSTVIDWAMVELIRNPGMMKKAQAEVRQVYENKNSLEDDDLQKLKYLKLVIKETMRLHPAVPMLLRASREECEVNGYTIAADVKVLTNIWGMQRDPRYWKDPERFDPDRFLEENLDFTGGDFRFLPFGTGKRICPGVAFGLTTVEVALAYLLFNFNWELPQGVRAQDMDMTENVGITSPRKTNLFVLATPYPPLA